MTKQTYTPEQRAADAVIHNAIYGPWDEARCRVCGWPVKEKIRDGCTKDVCSMVDREGKRADEPRRFHESHDARAALLKWIDKQPLAIGIQFIRQLASDLGVSFERDFYPSEVLPLMCATPTQIATAALKVIKEMEE